MGDNLKYDCLTCPYPRYRDENHIYCDICIREILDRHKTEMEVHDGRNTKTGELHDSGKPVSG